jgi:glycosyltransferase involved in cell wall biosynthesis
VIIPAHNEAATIGEIAGKASAFGTVFVMDDCSRDATAENAASAGAIVLSNTTNLGYDANIERGLFEAAKRGFDAAVTVDADGEHDPAIIAHFYRQLIEEKCALALGVRPRKARFSENIMGLVIKWKYGVTDILCGMKGYRLDLFRENGGFDHCNSIGTELAIASIRRGHAFVEIPVTGRPRVDQSRFGSLFRANVRIFRALWNVMTMKLPSPGAKS